MTKPGLKPWAPDPASCCPQVSLNTDRKVCSQTHPDHTGQVCLKVFLATFIATSTQRLRWTRKRSNRCGSATHR